MQYAYQAITFLTLLSLRAATGRLLDYPADSCGFLVCFLMNSTILDVRSSPLAVLQN